MSDITDSRISAAEEYMAERFVDIGSPGLASGILREGELVWARGFGVADLAAGNRPNEKTIARVASITKTFTATAIMQLRDRGLLDLDDPVTAHLPEFGKVLETGGRVADVTLRRMLTHYSGLSAETALMSWGAEEFPGLGEVLGALPRTEVVIAADSQWKYSNLAFGLLGEVVSRLSGADYVSYVRENVIEPLGMVSTGFEREDLPAEHLYTGYDAIIPGRSVEERAQGRRVPAPERHSGGGPAPLLGGRPGPLDIVPVPRGWRRGARDRGARRKNAGGNAPAPVRGARLVERSMPGLGRRAGGGARSPWSRGRHTRLRLADLL